MVKVAQYHHHQADTSSASTSKQIANRHFQTWYALLLCLADCLMNAASIPNPLPTYILYLPSLCVLGTVFCQDDDEEKLNKLCEDKSAGELFRLKAGKDNCRDVIQCTAAVSCPHIFNWKLIFHSIEGITSNQMSSRFGFRSGETNLWLEMGCEELW